MSDYDETGFCAICFHLYEHFGNNPQPILSLYEDRVCNDCNMRFVVPARLGDPGATEEALTCRRASKRAFNKAILRFRRKNKYA